MGLQTFEIWDGTINEPANMKYGLQIYELWAANINGLANMNYGLQIIDGPAKL